MLCTLLLLALPLSGFSSTEPQGEKPAKEKALPLVGWPGVFPASLTGWSRTLQQPVVSKDGKAYRQTVRYEWTGGAAKRLDVTLGRDAAIKVYYDPKELERRGNPPEKLMVGKYTAWRWEFKNLQEENQAWQVRTRLVVLLGEDRILRLEASGPGPWEQLETLVKRFDLEKLGKALDAPPRTDFRRTVEAFRKLEKGMSYAAVAERVGEADRDIGSGIHVMVYDLPDGSRVLLGFPGFEKLLYAKHEVKAGQVVDLVK